uniref:Reverse transcriptase domain-containing protein n=1 Tax=Cyprinus carpio carpio TaxID=630221 RepID=A0A9J7Z4K7_CYPCA
MFKQAATYNNTTDLQEYSETVTAYITKCIDDVTVTKTITVRANQKPWMTGEVYSLLKMQNAAFRAGDEVGLRTARANLSRSIRQAKRQYSRRIAHRFSDSRDTRSLWQGIQTITDYKPPPRTCDSNISLLNELNAFFARFEEQNSTTAQKTPPPPGDQVMTLTSDSVRRSFSRINARKAPGPDNIPGSVLRDCAVELTDVFTDIFNISLSQAVVPTCFKATTIIPVPKKPSPFCFNDYRPVALTPILMKCFEWLVMHHIKSALPLSLDPFQFAYQSNRSTDDAIATALHSALSTHIDKKDSYVRMLFIDFSSAFNTIIPQQLIYKLVQLGLNTSLCNWLLDFLTGRPLAVRVGSNTSSTITLNTGVPQGFVLSPLLFTLLTHDCTPSHNSNLFIKFADDTTVVGLISNRDETNYRSEVSRLAGWCSDNNLSLNMEKMKEIVVDFRRVHTQHAPLTINDATVERVSSTKFLGVHITEDLSWTINTAALAKKAQQRLLRKLRRARAPAPIMCTFYRGTIESILTSCITV